MDMLPARPSEVAAGLDAAAIHVWWLPRRRDEGRNPLRRILAGYLDVPPEAVPLREGAHGRPYLDGTGMPDFNWSHSGTRAVVAVARTLPRLGVDIEHVRPGRAILALAERYFDASEYRWLARLPSAHRPAAFVRLWTAKESILKAHGRGLAYGLERVVLALEDESPRAVRLDGDLGAPDSWHFRHWHLDGNGHATLCWQGGPRRLRHFMPPTAR